MFIDCVIPHHNEGIFIEMAHELGYSALCFLYTPEHPPRPLEHLSFSPLKLYSGSLSLKLPSDLVIVKSSEDDRHALESLPIDGIFSLEEGHKKDFLHHRASGLNHIFCSIAAQQRKLIVFNFSSLLYSRKKDVLMGRITQNVRLCRKYNTEMSIMSFAASPYDMRSPHDLLSLYKTLGMTHVEARCALSSAEERIITNRKKKKYGFFSDKITILDE